MVKYDNQDKRERKRKEKIVCQKRNKRQQLGEIGRRKSTKEMGGTVRIMVSEDHIAAEQ